MRAREAALCAPAHARWLPRLDCAGRAGAL